MVATVTAEPYIKCLETLISWEKVDAVISLSGNAGPLSALMPELAKRAESLGPSPNLEKISQEVAEGIAKINQRVCDLIVKYQKPILAVGENPVKSKSATPQADFSLPQFRTPERAARAAGALYQYSRYRKGIGAV